MTTTDTIGLKQIYRSVTTILFIGLMAALAGCGGGKETSREKLLASEVTSTIGVNAYLWRATLDTLDFMPLAQTDSKGGVVVTDWYTNPDVPAERVKVTVYILDKRLRADALKATVFRQWLRAGEWVDQPATEDAAAKIEDAILTQARYIRLKTVPEN